ncbi:hypothetical protein CUV01_12225 [Paracoccus tegillarcae]|uniref:Uncharacterized protein n=1 Tax=Paracoccus tegillarcae TaxID=1529068 RepID=A0A2K9EKW2_9RHOB|nr:hypothetical protein CUV01_12225 [Paracoccus tegillarcae]
MSLLLIAAVLPWGAYAAVWANPTPVAASAEVGLTAPTDPAADFVMSPRRCHGPALPGAVCVGDGLMLPGASLPVSRDTSGRLRPGGDWHSQAVSGFGLLDPPRAG